MGLLKVKDEETTVQEPSLAEKIGDNSIEKGLPDLDNPQGKSNMGKVGLFLGLLFATGLVAAGLIMFTSSDDESEAPDKNAQAEMVTATQSHNFNQDKSELEEQETLEIAVASEAQAASEVQPVEVETISRTPTPEPVTPADTPPQAISTEPPPATEPVQATTPPPAKPSPHERKLSGSVLVDNKSGSDNAGAATQGDNLFTATATSSLPPVSGKNDDEGKTPQNTLAAQLNPTQTLSAKAQNRGNRDYLLAKGTNILCTLDTQIITTRAGFTRCVVTRDVYSANGRVLLLEKGTKIIGEQTAAMLHGQARVGILWNEVNTPNGITVPLASPAAGQLGAAGVPARMKYHFWQRFGGAVLISLIGDLGDSFSKRQKSSDGGQNISFENSTEAAQEMATEALKNSINIPPTAYINHGTLINIMVARDVDFSGVYEVVKPYDIF